MNIAFISRSQRVYEEIKEYMYKYVNEYSIFSFTQKRIKYDHIFTILKGVC